MLAFLWLVPGSLVRGDGQWAGLAFLAFWMVPFLVLYLAENSSLVLVSIPIAALGQAAVVLYQGVF